MPLTAGQVADFTDGELRGANRDREISEVVTDSRDAFPNGALFVALCGENFDGHDFVDDAFDQGAGLALVEEDRCSDRPRVLVPDTLQALQRLAARWRDQFDIPVIGITGSNGKTLVKDMLSAILAQTQTVHRSPGSYNSQIGVPLALLGLRAGHDVAVIEAGISQVGEMENLAAMIRPTAGAITNIGLAHAAGLKTKRITAREKLKLFDGLDDGTLAAPVDCEPLSGFSLPGTAHRFGVGPGAGAAGHQILDVSRNNGRWSFELRFPDGERRPMELNAPGRHNLQNAACAATVADLLGAPRDAIRRGLASFEPIPLRTEMHTTPGGVTLINDAYSSDPTSARAALSTLADYGSGRRKIAILGDMLDLGDRSRQAHRRLGRVAAGLQLDYLVCYGPRASQIGDAASDEGFPDDHIIRVKTLGALHDFLDDRVVSDDVILFKASRALELDRAAERLLESVGPTRLHIDLGAVRGNYHAIRRSLERDVQFMAVVKSFGYGNDATRVSQTLARQGVDALAVAYPDEAIPLRRRGLSLPILVTNALAEEADKLVDYDLTPLVYSRNVVRALARRARTRHTSVDVHLKVDTGMNRVGLAPEDVLPFARWVDGLDVVDTTGIMTHFAAADVPEEDEFTRGQIGRFRQTLDALDQAGLRPPIAHAANTAAAWRFPDAHFDMVRVGLGLYGLAPSPAVDHATDDITPALTFTTRILHLHDVEPGDTVGYGRAWRADRPRQIATIAAGYNDGLPRFMSNGGEVLIGGQRCPIVGTVCMDVAMVDVTELQSVDVGDEVVIFGRQNGTAQSVDALAERGDTINYEILCNISDRVRRIFVRH